MKQETDAKVTLRWAFSATSTIDPKNVTSGIYLNIIVLRRSPKSNLSKV